MPTLMLFGHGASLQGENFNFQRPAANASTIYFWAAEGRPSRVYSDVMSSIIANGGTIPKGWYHESKSRIGGTLVTDHLLQDPTLNPNLVPWLPNNFAILSHKTPIAALNGTVYHDAANIAASNLMLFRINDRAASIHLATILANANFSARPLEIAWLICRVD